MTDAAFNSKKLKRQKLPPGWIERFSKKYPDTPFYFNKKTGESMWSLPTESREKVMESERKGKKRKLSDKESEESIDTTLNTTKDVINTSTPNRPKLKAKTSKVVRSDDKQSQSQNDTPAMRMYREKLAQRKAEMEAKKNTPKASKQKQNRMSTSPASKIVPETNSLKSSLQIQRRRRTCSVLSTSEISSSEGVNISKASTADSKIKVEPSVVKPMTRNTRSLISIPKNNKISKISKPHISKTNSSKLNLSNCDTTVNESVDNESMVDESAQFSVRRSAKKNYANDRMETLRKSISNEKDIKSPIKHFQDESNINISKLNRSSLDKSKIFSLPIPSIHRNVRARLYSVENRVRNSGHVEINRNKQDKINEEENTKAKKILNKFEVANGNCEQMEWEPIEDEKIMSEVYSVRYQLCEKPIGKLNEFSCNALQSLDTSGEKHALYIIIDTNVFLSNLPFIEDIKDSYSEIFGRPFIVIPWTVLQELDFIKDNKNHTRSQALKLKARKAVEFLNKHFTAKHPRFLGQTPMDVEKNKKKFIIECPDDEILQTCLQIKESSKSPVLLSYDKNLCNKAMVHDIPILGRNDPLEKMYYLKAAETTEFLSNNLHTHVEENQEDMSLVQKELLAADDLIENGKAVLKAVLSEAVAKEMETLFGNRWEMHVIIRPPWSIVSVLKCALKHWMAAVNESFTRRTESMLRDILEYINEVPEGGRKLQDVKFFLEKCKDVIQTLNDVKYPVLKSQMLTKIEDLRQTCLTNIEELKNERLKGSVGSEEDAGEEERRSALAFKVFEEIYAFARDTCGLSADAIGLPCSFSYNKLHPFLTTKVALQQQRDVGISVNKLLQVLRTTLSRINDGSGLENRIIVDLYEVLVNFSSDLSFEELSQVTPLDIYCCIKLKKATLEKGYEQLQELAIHFCRMANFQCT